MLLLLSDMMQFIQLHFGLLHATLISIRGFQPKNGATERHGSKNWSGNWNNASWARKSP